jgi:hypothetical protein
MNPSEFLRKMRYIAHLPLHVFGSIAFAVSAAAQDNLWIISETQAICILSHAEDYRSTGAPVIIIHAASCPDTNPFAGAVSGKQNYGGVGKIKSTSEKGRFNDVITFTADDFNCLTMDQVRIEDGVAYLPKRDTCGR